MNCNSCGARLYKNAKFCANCGNKFIDTTKPNLNPAKELVIDFEEKEEPIKQEASLENQKEEIIQISTEKPKTSKFAITGFVLSLCGIIPALLTIFPSLILMENYLISFLFFVFYYSIYPIGIIGIIFSSIALKDIKKKNLKGKGFAITGLVVSIVLLASRILYYIGIFFVFILVALALAGG